MFLAVIRYYTAPVIITTVYHFITFEIPYPTWSNTVAFELWLRVVKASLWPTKTALQLENLSVITLHHIIFPTRG